VLAVYNFADLTKINALLFVVIFTLNILPAFAPPTWVAMSFIGLTVPDINPLLTALIAATAAASGRIVLARLSHMLVRQRWLSERTQRNVDAITFGIESRPAITFGAFLGYAVSPLPSNYLFIAYGLTSLPIAYLAIPFFVGRVASYSFWLGTAATVGEKLDLDWFESVPYFVGYFLFSQLALIPVIYCFTRIDWHAALTEKRLKWLGSHS